MGGERRLTEEVPTDSAALQGIATVQALETEVRLVKVLAMAGRPVRHGRQWPQDW